MVTVSLYYRDDCALCAQAIKDLQDIQLTLPFNLVLIDITCDPVLLSSYELLIPVVKVGPYQLNQPFTKIELAVAIGAAQDRAAALEASGDKKFKDRKKRGSMLSGSDQFSFWLSKHYLFLFNTLAFFYIGLPFLAPVLMKSGAVGPAQIIYSIYKPLCHQFAFRSWFLFGVQPFYPRELAKIPGVITYEQLTGESSLNILEARAFLGNNLVGYKVALCQRDVAIYGSILLFGILFSFLRKKLKAVPWFIFIWVIVGIIPIGIDGTSQLPGLNPYPFLSWLPYRESTPILRTITGALFGIMTAWYIYPLIEETMQETRKLMLQKIAVLKQVAR
jgi:uncharacterized membrane protein